MKTIDTFKIHYWDDTKNEMVYTEVGLAQNRVNDIIEIFVSELDVRILNSIVKYTTFIENVFMVGLNIGGYFDVLDKYTRLRVYFGNNRDHLVNEFIIDKFVPYFRRDSLPLFYYERFLTKEEKERNNIIVEENKIDPRPFLVYWFDKVEGKYKMNQAGIWWSIDEEKNLASVFVEKSEKELKSLGRKDEAIEQILKTIAEAGWSGEVKIEYKKNE